MIGDGHSLRRIEAGVEIGDDRQPSSEVECLQGITRELRDFGRLGWRCCRVTNCVPLGGAEICPDEREYHDDVTPPSH